METRTINEEILNELQEIKTELHYIKVHMVDMDTILTGGDREALREAEEEYKRGETTSLEELEKELKKDV